MDGLRQKLLAIGDSKAFGSRDDGSTHRTMHSTSEAVSILQSKAGMPPAESFGSLFRSAS